MSPVSPAPSSRIPSTPPPAQAAPPAPTTPSSPPEQARAPDTFTSDTASRSSPQPAPESSPAGGPTGMSAGTASGRLALAQWEAPAANESDAPASCPDEDDTGNVGDTDDLENTDDPEVDDLEPQEADDCDEEPDPSEFDPADDADTSMEDDGVEDPDDGDDPGDDDGTDSIDSESARALAADEQDPTTDHATGCDSPPGPGQDDQRDLKRGDDGDDVRALQDRLRDLGYFKGDSTGHFGPKTEAAVREFQRDHGISPIGKAGPKTRGALGCASPDDPKKGGTEKKVDVPFISQFSKTKDGKWVFRNHNQACFRTCKAMLKRVGLKPGGPTQDWPGRTDKNGKKHDWTYINVARKEDGKGHIAPDQKKLGAARSYIDAQLDKGRPVIVGVSDRYTGYNKGTGGHTDHYIVITGRGIDPKTGQTYYTFNDPGRGSKANGGSDNTSNRLYVDPTTGNLVRPYNDPVTGKPIPGKHPHYELSEVRRNLPY